MEAINKEFVEKRLSNKSSFYIINDLFQNTQRIENEMLSLTDYDKEKIFVVGDLSQMEFELYVIMTSLSRRIHGTRLRIRDTSILDEEGLDLLHERQRRLKELELDWEATRRRLHILLEINHKEQIEKVKSKNPGLLKKEYYWTEYNDFSGYVYVFFKERKFGMTNRYAMGGD